MTPRTFKNRPIWLHCLLLRRFGIGILWHSWQSYHFRHLGSMVWMQSLRICINCQILYLLYRIATSWWRVPLWLSLVNLSKILQQNTLSVKRSHNLELSVILKGSCGWIGKCKLNIDLVVRRSATRATWHLVRSLSSFTPNWMWSKEHNQNFFLNPFITK